MKILFSIVALAFALPAEDSAPIVEQLQAKVVEQSKQLAEAQKKIAEFQRRNIDLSREVILHQRALFQCQDEVDAIHAQPPKDK